MGDDVVVERARSVLVKGKEAMSAAIRAGEMDEPDRLTMHETCPGASVVDLQLDPPLATRCLGGV